MAGNEEQAQPPFYQQGNFAPVKDELTAYDLTTDGAIPPGLRGLYLRNGPNPKSGASAHWFVGDGMVHGVRLDGGRACWYRNRWVRTRAFQEEGAELVRPDGSVDRTVGVANTHIIGHGGRLFALVESSFPTEMTPELETIGVCDFEGRLETAMTAHPKRCPLTGELHFFGYGFAPPYLTYHRLDATGRLVQSEVIDVPGPTMIHDFAITERHVVFMDLPLVFCPEVVADGGLPYRWSDEYGARIGTMPRGGSGGDVRWFEIEPCYVLHPLNAFEDGDRVVVDVARYPEFWRSSGDSFPTATLHRWSVDLAAEKVIEQGLDDRPIEFPRIDDRLTGRRHRYGFAVSATTSVADPSGLVKYDLATGRSEVCEFGPGQMPGEGVFVPDHESAGEDEGWVIFYLYDAARDGSDLVILDASAFTGPPVARVRLPQRVPFGFHGSWIPDPA